MLTEPTKILAVPSDWPEKLFTGPAQVTDEYRALARRFHPDRGGDGKILAHINILHDAAEKRIEDGTWRTPGRIDFAGTDGKLYRIRFRREFDIGIGRGYIGEGIVAYVFGKDVADMARIGEQMIGGIRFKAKTTEQTEKLRTEFKPRLPTIKKAVDLQDGGRLIVVEKPTDAIRLRDILDREGGFLDPRHVAWIMSEMANLCCFLTQEGITHNDLSLDSVFVRPALHHIHLTGGWWYAAPIGERMRRLQTARTVSAMPSEVLRTKNASVKTDLEQVRLLGRELLGDEIGMRLAMDKRVSPVLADWLRSATTGIAKSDFKQWQNTLTSAFGARRFTKMEITFSDIYKED